MTILRDISIIWSMLHVLVLFVLLYQSRYSKKTTAIWTGVVMGTWVVLHAVLVLWLGPTIMARLVIFTGTIPSFIFFWIMSKQRDGRFIFTFCLCDTLSAEILLLTNLLDAYLFGGKFIGMFVLRLIMFPLLEVYAYKVMRPLLQEVQKSVRKGWYVFAGVSAIFYLILVLIGSFPDTLLHSAEMLPVNVLILLLMPLMYWNIFQVLLRQQKFYELAEQENVLKMQVSNMQNRIGQYSEADEKFRIERHDMRHRLQTITEMLQNGEIDKLRDFVFSAQQKLEGATVKRYCANPVLDAVFTAYFRIAEGKGIEVRSSLAVPEELSVDAAELSTVFANAIENAVHACEQLPEEERVIELRAVAHPQFMFQIVNPYEGEVRLDERGVPIASESGHGFGTRSIVAFCEKYGAFYEFKAENGNFALRIVVNN